MIDLLIVVGIIIVAIAIKIVIAICNIEKHAQKISQALEETNKQLSAISTDTSRSHTLLTIRDNIVEINEKIKK